MITAKLSQIADAIDAQLVGGDAVVSQVYTDSRVCREEGLFVALKGPHFDAHDFIQQVAEQGAKAVVVEQRSSVNIPQLIVKDTRLALGNIARFNRQRLDAKFIAITGSSGKTTVKEMVASILQNIGSTFSTRGNFNNEIGAPLTILEMNAEHDFGVIELGANHAGEIDYTASIVQPHVAMINNVAASHLEGFGDLQGVARAKGEIYSQLEENGIAIVNSDDDFAGFWHKHINNKTLTFGIEKEAMVKAEQVELDENHCAKFYVCYAGNRQLVQLSLAGKHNVYNALAAASCAIAIGIDLADVATGLAQTPIVSGRLMTEELDNGCRVIDDTYNANMDSMKAAIELLGGYDKERILVIGDMAELGEFGRQCHEDVGEIARREKIDKLYSCGVLTQFSHIAFKGAGKHFTNQNDLIKQLKQEAKANTTILVKGSRSAHMEKVVQALMDNESVASQEGEH